MRPDGWDEEPMFRELSTGDGWDGCAHVSGDLLVDTADQGKVSCKSGQLILWPQKYSKQGRPKGVSLVLSVDNLEGRFQVLSRGQELLDYVSIARCQVTGNPINTDTHRIGHPCGCPVCTKERDGKLVVL